MTEHMQQENQQNEEQKKQRVIKGLAVGGFIGLIIVIAWLGVQLIGLAPSAFNSLASVADTVYNYDADAGAESFTVTSDRSLVDSGNQVTINWTESNIAGAYTFGFDCDTDVRVTAFPGSDAEEIIGCGTPYELGDSTSLEIQVTSEAARYADLHYQVVFTPENPRVQTISTSGSLTVVNANVTEENTDASDNTNTSNEDRNTTTEDDTETPEQNTNTSSGNNATEETTTSYRYEIPQSNPNGFTELEISYQGVGEIRNNRFVAQSQLEADERGAFRFQVKNTGTKTSGAWSYKADLPNGETYRSGSQTPLRPNEQTTITLGFTMDDDTGSQSFGVTLDANDRNQSNNSFDWSVRVNR